MSKRVVVIGGGVSGLTAAYYLKSRLGAAGEVIVLEGDRRVGGKALTREVGGLQVDTGPDAFLSRAPQLASLVDELGLRSEVVEPAATGAYVWSRGKLRKLPPGSTFGLPEKVVPLVLSGLITIPGALRALFDLFLPAKPLPADYTVEQLVRPRFGREVFNRMVEPLLGGVHAGSAKVLSAPATVPEIVAMAKAGRSMVLTMQKRKRKAPKPSGKAPAALVSLHGTIESLPRRLAEELGDRVRLGVKVERVERTDGGYLVHTSQGVEAATDVVFAVPAYVAAKLLAPLAPAAAAKLDAIPYVDTAGVLLAFRRSEVKPLPYGTGFLIPPVEQEFIVGCTWLTSKWPQLVNDEVVVIRNLVGRWGDKRWLAMDDQELVDRVREALRRMIGITAEPFDAVIQRWPAAMPQYVVGHSQRLNEIEADLDALGGLHLTGAAYRGVGLAGCVAQGHAVATRIAEDGR